MYTVEDIVRLVKELSVIRGERLTLVQILSESGIELDSLQAGARSD